jgi:hypothetical protein
MSAGTELNVSFEEILQIARDAAAENPGDGTEAQNLRARGFFVGLVSTLNNSKSAALADALHYPHLSALAKRLAASEAGA